MFWLFDKDPKKYFHDWILDNAIKADNEDKKSSKSIRHLMRNNAKLIG